MQDLANLFVGIVGTGVMGRSIAEWLSEKGLSVTVWGRSDASLHAAQAAVQKSRHLAVRRKRLDSNEEEAANARLRYSLAWEDLSACHLVIETVSEDETIKRKILSRIVANVSNSTLIATNTSSLPLAELVAAVPHPERFLGLHFMNPVPQVNLVEIIAEAATSADTLETAENFCGMIDRQFVRVKDSPGFIVNRLLMPLLNEAAKVVEEGIASPQDIDKAIRLSLGHPLGPLGLADLIGLDIVQEELENLTKTLGSRFTCAPLITSLVAQNQLGRKTGKGLLASRNDPQRD